MIRLGFLVVLVGVATADVHAQAQPKPNVESATTQNEPQALPGEKAVGQSPTPTQTPSPSNEARPNVTPQLDEEAFSLGEAVKAFAKTILMLLVVLLVAYLLLGKGLPKLMNRTLQGNRMKVVERLPLDQKRTLFLVEVDGQTYLLGGADGQVSLIDKAKPEETGFAQKMKQQQSVRDALKEVG